VAAALLSAGPAAGQDSPRPTLGLGFAMGSPGRNVTIPFSLQGATDGNLGRIEVTITFRGDVVSFLRLERAGLLDESVQTKATLREPAEGVKTPNRVLDVRVTGDTVALEDGILGYLVFRIDPEAKVDRTPEVVLDVSSSILVRGAKDEDPPLAVTSEPGRILLEHPDLPIIACFFYMH
jgi:hypothetical protein